VIGKIALQIHAAQQKAGHGKAVGPISPVHIKLGAGGEATLELADNSSLGYSSPEQTMGGFGDRRSDVFSLGTVLWEALTYQRLFDAMNDAAVRMAVQEREITPPSEVNANVPAELSAICMRALNRNPTDRYQSAKAMAVEIEEFLEEAGYSDDDTKIASYLATMHEPPKQMKVSLAPPDKAAVSEVAVTQPLERPKVQPAAQAPVEKPATQPPPMALASPSILGEPPKPEAKGAALAAALAASGNGSSASSLPPAASVATAVGVPKLDDWKDAAAAPHAPPPAAAPVVSVDAASASGVTPPAVPTTPLPPVLPTGSTALRNDKSTISVAVPPQVKVATVDAKHAEAKQPLIVEDKQQHAIVDDGKATLVDARGPYISVPTAEPKSALAAARVDVATPNTAETMPVPPVAPAETKAAEPRPRAKSESEAGKRAGSQSEATKRPGSQSEATKRPGSQSEATRRRSPSEAPHPVAAVTLGPGHRESKDELDNWGWGTDKHEAISPESYDDDYQHPEPNSRKMLVKIIGVGMGVVALIIVVAFAFGGSSDKKTTAAKQPAIEPGRTVVDKEPVPPAPPPEAAEPVATGSDVAPAPPPAETSEAEKAEAAKADAAKLEAEKAEQDRVAAEHAKHTEAAKAEAAKAEAAKAEAAKAEAAKAEAARAEADRVAAEKAEAKKQEVANAEAAKREAAEKKQADQAAAAEKKQEAARLAAEKKQEAARLAAEKKQEAARVAAEKAEARKQEAARIAEAKKLAKKNQRPAKTEKKAPKTETRVAKAEPGKLDTESAYRFGLQQFARGDTSGALASLRTSLAGNPNYAPTWRGLGMVFEKMGEKDQARAAYKRYLQLAPGASDTDQIKGRLERLGS
jgi:hypothetical protein